MCLEGMSAEGALQSLEEIQLGTLFHSVSQFFRSFKFRNIQHYLASIHVYVFDVLLAFIAVADSPAGEADSSRPSGLTSPLLSL